MRRINWPFAFIVMIAVTAVINGAFLWDQFWVPRPFRHHFTDFGSVAFLTAILTIVFNSFAVLLRSIVTDSETGRNRFAFWIYLFIPIPVAFRWIMVELENLYGIEDEGFDPGAWVDTWLGRPNIQTFDRWDVVTIIIGGLLVFCLQLRSIKRIRQWGLIPLWYIPDPT